MNIDCIEFCRALADVTRQRMLILLQDRPLCVGDLVAAFRLTQPTVSHHLAVLHRAGLVERRKEGKQVYYSASRDHVLSCCGRLMTELDARACCPTPPAGQVEIPSQVEEASHDQP